MENITWACVHTTWCEVRNFAIQKFRLTADLKILEQERSWSLKKLRRPPLLHISGVRSFIFLTPTPLLIWLNQWHAEGGRTGWRPGHPRQGGIQWMK